MQADKLCTIRSKLCIKILNRDWKVLGLRKYGWRYKMYPCLFIKIFLKKIHSIISMWFSTSANTLLVANSTALKISMWEQLTIKVNRFMAAGQGCFQRHKMMSSNSHLRNRMWMHRKHLISWAYKNETENGYMWNNAFFFSNTVIFILCNLPYYLLKLCYVCSVSWRNHVFILFYIQYIIMHFISYPAIC